ncbi:glycosyltransferase family 2 protein [Microvirga rosea]|uniref:glycosyltransferase family 2 protein n=1 Tax=Microvirga rosea TaxID=2715425 RepID=UPI001D0ABEB6|nr:cellulose synthase catalytic subunit [Microvirga rosea]MCB8822174.1 glycosyltransferase [Microvirga rosea]
MLTLDIYWSSYALVAVVVGLILLVGPLARRSDSWVRVSLLILTTVLAWRYMIWRITATVPPFSFTFDAIASWVFLLIETLALVSSTSAYFILTRRKERHQEADANVGWWGDNPPQVDLYIATYNEERAVLERTLAGARAIDYPRLRVFVLDDGRREWLTELCREYGAEHRTRPDNHHAKAGNINYTLMQRLQDVDPPAFAAVLDADFVPHANFVKRVLALFHDPKVGLVQTPQHFFNPDPIQHNLGIAQAYPDEQRFFFDHLEPARDGWGVAVCCGTSSMVRIAGVQKIGGLPTESVTEDFLLTIRLDENGYRTVYLNEPLTEGLAPEGLQEYIVQRGRWCLGMMEIIRNVYNPLGGNRLRLMQRVSLMDSLMYWTTTFPFRLISLVCPLLYWYFGIIVVNASVSDVVSYYMPYYFAVLFTLNWISGGLIMPILNDVSQLLAAWPITRAVWMGLFTPGPHKFRVTAKGGDRTKAVVQWPIMRPFAILFVLTILGLLLPLTNDVLFSHVSKAGDGLRIILFWTLYNLAVLTVTMLACIERPRANRPQRIVTEQALLSIGINRFYGWITDLGIDRARLRGPAGLNVGDRGTIELKGVGEVGVRVSEAVADGYLLDILTTPQQYPLLLRKLHTADAAPGTTRGDLSVMIKSWARLFASR